MFFISSFLLATLAGNSASAFSPSVLRSSSISTAASSTATHRHRHRHRHRNQLTYRLLQQNHYFSLHSLSQKVIVDGESIHDVQGITCREVDINVEVVGRVSILEATADSQNELVDMALATEEEIASLSESDSLQLTLTSGDPYGAVLWPAASAVANHLLTSVAQDLVKNGKSLKDITILELGTGTGLVSLAAALGGVSKIMATDYENVPLQLLEFAAKHINHNGDSDNSDNNQSSTSDKDERQKKLSNIETFLFDICDHDTPLPAADIVVAADIMYEPKTGTAMAYRVVEALKCGSRVIVGCSPGRYVSYIMFKEAIGNRKVYSYSTLSSSLLRSKNKPCKSFFIIYYIYILYRTHT